LNRDLIIPDINFWYSMLFLVMEQTTHETTKGFCETGFGVFSKPGVRNLLSMFLRIDFEVYIGFNKKTYQYTNGTVNQAVVDAAGDGLATSLTGGNASALADNTTTSRRLSLEDLEGLRYEDVDANRNTAKRSRLNADDPDTWRLLTETYEEVCLVLTVSCMEITIPAIGGIYLARAMGGWCFLSPEDSGVQCTPNGLFFNLDQQIELGDGLSVVLGTFLNEGPPTVGDTQSGGASLGLYFNQERVFQVVVLRIELPARSFFGVTFGVG
jgi:hypothetical protein